MQYVGLFIGFNLFCPISGSQLSIFVVRLFFSSYTFCEENNNESDVVATRVEPDEGKPGMDFSWQLSPPDSVTVFIVYTTFRFTSYWRLGGYTTRR